MRYRLYALMLLVVLPAMSVLAAPAPEPTSAVLDIGSPPKGKTAKEYSKDVIGSLTLPRGSLWLIQNIDEVKKLASGARLKEKEVGPWLVKNMRTKEEDGGRRLRFTFRAGTRAEQAAILNAMLRCYMRGVKQSIKDDEEFLNKFEGKAKEWAKASEEERDPKKKAELQDMAEGMIKTTAPGRAEVDRVKQIKVIKWAK